MPRMRTPTQEVYVTSEPVLAVSGDVGGGERQLGNLRAGAPVHYLALRRGFPQAHQVHLDPQILNKGGATFFFST